MSATMKLRYFLPEFLMQRLQPLLVGIPVVIFSPWLASAVASGSTPCFNLVQPLDNKVSSVKEQGGIWSLFEKGRGLSDHSPLALQFDSKIISLMYILNYLCETEEGIPYDDLALYLESRFREKGGEGPVRDELENMGHSREEVTILLEFQKFAEKSRHRKLDLNQIKKTIDKADEYAERYWLLAQKLNRRSPVSVVEEVKVLARDIDKFRATDPYMVQADYENAQVPHTSLTESSDEM